ncbi:Type III effector phosphothreonine lyase [Pseudomonas caricapapayae]|uniref:Type III effector phosphothreonine lyase n=1 Tax=Pseudomonas caricapapayae TaxID=46678 RepID=A0A0N8QTX7_9PSED|nr:type III effector [Pseudomonas caricapapayae]KAA8691291.1 type III effector [Pseudomonas caricapapayae]KPW62822.1 Type III effector phosphothreonine lyase [Pseudomonas caricapapayae]RMM05530.1 Type III effector phosphothreonine lyase [Pseudomonas caricapapayae]
MAVTKPMLNLKLNTQLTPPAVKKDTSAELSRLNPGEVRANTQTRFALNHRAPTYAVAQRARGENHGGWTVFNTFRATGTDLFIHMDRREPKSKGDFAGDKFHLSVAPEHVASAFDAIGKLLQADDSPVDKWKVTDMNSVQTHSSAEQARVTQGAQFTLYAKPDRADNTYSPQYMGKMRGMISSIEHALRAAGVAQSRHRPASDVAPGHWAYASYRNEHRSERAGSASQVNELQTEPFFQLVSLPDMAASPAMPNAGSRSLLPPPWTR